MTVFGFMWKKLTQTKALEQSGGRFETAFFEPVYRVRYLTGISFADKGGYLVYSYSVKVMMLLFVASELGFLFSVSLSLDEVIANISVTLIHLIAIYRYRNLLIHKEIFKNLATSMESSPNFDVSTPRRRAILECWVKTNEKYVKLLLALGNCTLAAWYVYPLLDDIEYNLVIMGRLPYKYNTPERYIASYIIVIIAVQYASFFVMSNDLIMQSHLLHLLCQFTVLGECFESILEDCKKDFPGLKDDALHLNTDFIQKYNERLGNLVEQHKFILRNTLDLRNILSVPMLYQMAASSMLICFAGYQVTATASLANITQFLTSLLYLGYNLFELFIFCKWCDEIKIQSENIRQAVYFSGWERMAMIPGVRARLMIIIARASRPLVFTAGGVIDLSLASYTAIVKTSYSALSVLLRTRND